MPLTAGQTFAGYTIVRLLGSGAMGEVYLAQHPRLPRQDALKILRPDVSADEDYRQRFIREADLAATLWHPNIVRVNDRGEHDGQLWLAMDYVEGTDAARLLGDQYPSGMPAGEVVAIVTAIAGALDYAHAHGLLHRDVKPANILLANPVDGERRILLGDFGIARATDDVSGLTATNMTMGTLPYASPEQLMGKPMDGRADEYSLAATSYHLLTGTTLFPESSPAAVIGSHLTTPPPPLASTRPELAALDQVLAVALAKDPARRFARCKDFAAAFTEASRSGGSATSWAATMQARTVTETGGPATSWASTMQAPVAAQPPQDPPPPGADTRPRRRRRGIVLAAAAATVVALTAAGVIGYFAKPGHKPPPAAVLNGTYRLVFNGTKRTLNGSPYPDSPAEITVWEAFRSTCPSATSCVATGTKLDDTNHQVAKTPADTTVLRFADGHWQRDPVRVQLNHPKCLGDDQKTVAAGKDTRLLTWSVEPQADGTLKGVRTETVITNECGLAGLVWQLPVVATRTGDVPTGVTVADPAAAPTAPSPPAASAVGGPVLTGAYRIDFDGVDQTANGRRMDGDAKHEIQWWAFRSWCSTATRCIATGAPLSDENHQQPSGNYARVLEFTDGHWQNAPDLVPDKCHTGDAYDSETVVWSVTPQSDATLRGTETFTALTNECGIEGIVFNTPMVLTRVGDVPPAVLLADPTLF